MPFCTNCGREFRGSGDICPICKATPRQSLPPTPSAAQGDSTDPRLRAMRTEASPDAMPPSAAPGAPPAQPAPLSEPAPAWSPSGQLSGYQYRFVQVPRNIVASSVGYTGQEAAAYLQNLVNQYSADGWEFHRIDTIGVQIKPGCGCLGALLGQQAQHVEYNVVSFRRMS